MFCFCPCWLTLRLDWPFIEHLRRPFRTQLLCIRNDGRRYVRNFLFSLLIIVLPFFVSLSFFSLSFVSLYVCISAAVSLCPFVSLRCLHKLLYRALVALDSRSVLGDPPVGILHLVHQLRSLRHHQHRAGSMLAKHQIRNVRRHRAPLTCLGCTRDNTDQFLVFSLQRPSEYE